MVLEAVAASGVTYQKEISRLGEDIKKLIDVQQKMDQSQKENEKCMKKHGQHLCDLETKSKRVENDVKKVRLHSLKVILLKYYVVYTSTYGFNSKGTRGVKIFQRIEPWSSIQGLHGSGKILFA